MIATFVYCRLAILAFLSSILHGGEILWFSDVGLDVDQDDYDGSVSDCIGNSTHSPIENDNLKCFMSGNAWGTVFSSMKQASSAPDFIVWSGASNALADGNVAAMKQISNDLSSSYAGVPVYPVLGTFDFAQDEDTLEDGVNVQQEVLTEAAAHWKQWIGDEAAEDLGTNGYYAVELKNDNKDMLVALNTVAMMKGARNVSDTGDQLEWLEYQLWSAQNASKSVVVIGHTGPGHPAHAFDDKYAHLVLLDRRYNDRLANLLASYNGTVKLSLFGGAHADSFTLLTTADHEDPVMDEIAQVPPPRNFLLNAGSVAPWSFDDHQALGVFKVIKLNDEWDVQDVDTWACNATEHSCTLEYSFADAYKLDNVSTESLGELVVQSLQMHHDPDLFYEYSNRTSPQGGQGEECDDECMEATLCAMAHASTRDYSDCTAYKVSRFWAALVFAALLLILLVVLLCCAFTGNKRDEYEQLD